MKIVGLNWAPQQLGSWRRPERSCQVYLLWGKQQPSKRASNSVWGKGKASVLLRGSKYQVVAAVSFGAVAEAESHPSCSPRALCFAALITALPVCCLCWQPLAIQLCLQVSGKRFHAAGCSGQASWDNSLSEGFAWQMHKDKPLVSSPLVSSCPPQHRACLHAHTHTCWLII